MSDTEEIIVDLNPTSATCKDQAAKVGVYHLSHINIEITLFASKHRHIGLVNHLINSIKSRVKSFLKKATHVTVTDS